MLRTITTVFKKHVREHLPIYFMVILCFLIGVSVGTFTVKVLDGHQKSEITSYLRVFFQLFNNNEVKEVDIFKQSLMNNFQLLLLNWVAGILIITIPIVFLVIGFKGFILGFILGILFEEFKLKGLMLFLFGILPQNIIIFIIFIASGVISLSFAMMLIKTKINKAKQISFPKQIIIYSSVYLLLFGGILIASIVESFIAPFFIRFFSRLVV